MQQETPWVTEGAILLWKADSASLNKKMWLITGFFFIPYIILLCITFPFLEFFQWVVYVLPIGFLVQVVLFIIFISKFLSFLERKMIKIYFVPKQKHWEKKYLQGIIKTSAEFWNEKEELVLKIQMRASREEKDVLDKAKSLEEKSSEAQRLLANNY